MKKSVLWLTLIFLSGLNLTGQSILQNGDFEKGNSGMPDFWTTGSWRTQNTQFKWEANSGINNSKCISIEVDSSSPNDAWFVQEVDSLEAGKWYKIKGWMKGFNIQHPGSSGASLNILNTYIRSKVLKDSFDWTEVILDFRADSSGKANIACRLGFWAGICSGKVLFDNISVQKMNTKESKYFTFILDSNDLTVISDSNLNRWFNHLDSSYESYYDLTGFFPYGGEKITIQSVDYYPGGWAVAGNPIKWCKTYVKNELISINDHDNWSFGILHEIGHDYDDNSWNFNGEIMANLKMNYVLEQLNALVRQAGIYYRGTEIDQLYKTSYDKEKAEYHATGDLKGYGGAILHRFMEIQNVIGWEPFRKTFRDLYSLPDSMENPSLLQRYFVFIQKLSDYSGYDVYHMFPADDMNEFIAVIGNGPVNGIPHINLGADTVISPGETISFNPVISDDNYPSSMLNYKWEKIDTGFVLIGNVINDNIEARFDNPGIHELRLIADDGYCWGIDTVKVIVNLKPEIIALNDTTVLVSDTFSFSPGVIDDGLPYDQLNFKWLVLNDSDKVYISDPMDMNPRIMFSQIGMYYIQLEVSDGHMSDIDTIVITAETATFVENNFNKFNNAVYPNPINSTSVISFELKVNSSLNITLLDNYGRLIAATYIAELGEGTHTISISEFIDKESLQTGIYYLILNSEKLGRYSNKLIVD